MEILAHHEGGYLLNTRLRPNGDRIWSHGMGNGGSRYLLSFSFELLYRSQGNEPIQNGKKGGDGKLFLLRDQVTLAKDSHQPFRFIHHRDTIDSFFQKELCGMSNLRLGQDSDYIFCHYIFYFKHGYYLTILQGEKVSFFKFPLSMMPDIFSVQQ